MYTITNYDELYKPYDKSGGELRRADWVKLPVNPKGDGLNTLFEYKRGLEIFGIWCLLLEKATAEKSENRGKLLNHKDQPATILEIAKGISLKNKAQFVKYAISVLIDIGWVSCDGEAEKTSEEFQKTSPKSSVLKSSVEKGRVVKSREYSSEFEIFWKNFKGRYDSANDKYIKVGKWQAFEEWEILSPEQQVKATTVADKVRGKYVPDACRWLKNRLFDDFRT